MNIHEKMEEAKRQAQGRDHTHTVGARVYYQVEVREHWEDYDTGWFVPSTDACYFSLLQQKNSFATEEEAREAIQRCLDVEPYDHQQDMGWHYSDAQIEWRIRKHVHEVFEPVVVVGPPHPATLKVRPRPTHLGGKFTRMERK